MNHNAPGILHRSTAHSFTDKNKEVKKNQVSYYEVNDRSTPLTYLFTSLLCVTSVFYASNYCQFLQTITMRFPQQWY
ncbi:hypothetical protein H5410_045096 [Solanum commersonii]|uniref:Uncharacterized protein n=1 Tax=Solanum commersonii TaxID=4109 RepID=A0A9J5XBN3_SOLCO|nr:hypothetical protein H5410_045096 [Solanum commersonii]